MKSILQGFTLFVAGIDYGIECEELELPTPTPLTQEYRGGGMDLGVSQSMAALEPLEATFKFAGQVPDILAKTALGPSQIITVTARGAVLNSLTGVYDAHVAIINGQFNAHSRDRWQRGEKSGIEVTMGSIMTYRYEIGSRIVHDIQAYPPRRIVDGVDQLAGINTILSI